MNLFDEKFLRYLELVEQVKAMELDMVKSREEKLALQDELTKIQQENDKRAQEIKQLYDEYQEEVRRQNEAKCQQIRQAQQEVIAWVAATEKALRDDEKTIAAVNEENIKLEEAKKTLEKANSALKENIATMKRNLKAWEDANL